MALKEKGRPAGGDPIPNDVLADNAESKPQLLDLQVLRLNRRYGFAYEACIVIATLAWGIAR
jgi:hypothetical protein